MNEAATGISRFWGKLGARDRRGYHPLVCHMLDVAAVTEAMWDSVLIEPAKRVTIRGLGLTDAAAARSWVAFIAGAHDTGKCSPLFQNRAGAERLTHLYADSDLPAAVPSHQPNAAPHGVVTADALPGLLQARFGLDRPTSRWLATITGGHHGTFPGRPGETPDPRDVGTHGWVRARTAIIAALGDLLGVPVSVLPRRPVDFRLRNATAMHLAGLISISDWIGSEETLFRYKAEDNEAPAVDLAGLKDYLQTVRRQARVALEALHWMGWEQPAAPVDIGDLFPEIRDSLRDLQTRAVALAEAVKPPAIVVIEAPMGEGKTEAALYLGDRWGVAGGPRGCYVALPTQATSNQMFGRVREALARRHRGDVNLQLLHGHADLSAEFALLKQAGERHVTPEAVYDDAGELQDGTVIAGTWFTARKRGLLAPFGVGTVDQAMLAALQTKHVFVRLFGLAHKVVIVDEVHAYETYMSEVIARMLRWLGALSAPVVLLSATLPKARRDHLVRQYMKGAGFGEMELPAAGYPRITWAGRRSDDDQPEVGAIAIEVSSASRRTLQLRFVSGALEGGFPLGGELLRRIADGGCIAIVCNTVARAQRVYQELSLRIAELASEQIPEILLFHSRFLFHDRDRIEKEVLRKFGKPDPVNSHRPTRAILVATQVIEQSLDLDFDLMVSDFAPIDLLLQRSGREQRHDRRGVRPKGFEEGPELWICAPDVAPDGVPAFENSDEFIYDAHVLLRTWLALHKPGSAPLDSVAVPDDVADLIEATYDDSAPSESFGEPLRARWEETKAKSEQEALQARDQAHSRWLGPPDFAGSLHEFTNFTRDEDDPEAHPVRQALTRLTGPTVTVVLLYGDPEPEQGQRPAYFDATRSQPAQIAARPTLTQAQLLLERSVNLGHRGLAPRLLRQQPPSGWRRSSLLRHCRLVRLDQDGRATVEGWTIALHPELGVLIERSGDVELRRRSRNQS